MKINHVSTQATTNSLRLSIRQVQNDILRLQSEATTGKLADYGRTLGSNSGELTGAKRAMERLSTIMDTNALAASRLDVTQAAISHVRDYVGQLMSAATVSTSDSTASAAVLETAHQVLIGIEDTMNASLNGQSVFAGINTDAKVTDGYLNGAAKTAFDAAFLGHFGFDKNGAAAATIDEAAMTTFLDTVVTPQFFGADWTANYSNASDTGIVSRITETQTQVTSFSANDDGFRGAVMAAVIAVEFFDSNVSEAARQAVSQKVLGLGGRATSDLADLQGRAGVAEEALSRATARLESQSSILELRILQLEGVDQYEASTDLTTALTQLEISFSLTARMQRVSIMNYLS